MENVNRDGNYKPDKPLNKDNKDSISKDGSKESRNNNSSAEAAVLAISSAVKSSVSSSISQMKNRTKQIKTDKTIDDNLE